MLYKFRYGKIKGSFDKFSFVDYEINVFTNDIEIIVGKNKQRFYIRESFWK